MKRQMNTHQEKEEERKQFLPYTNPIQAKRLHECILNTISKQNETETTTKKRTLLQIYEANAMHTLNGL